MSKPNSDKYYALALAITALLVISVGLRAYLKRHDKLEYKDLTEITGVVANQLKVEGGAKGGHYIFLRLRNFPDVGFNINSSTLGKMDYNYLIYHAVIGDTITLNVSTLEYEKNVTKTSPLDLLDRIIDSHSLEFCSLEDSKRSYLSLDSYNEGENKDNELGIWFVLIGAILLCLSLAAFCLDKILKFLSDHP